MRRTLLLAYLDKYAETNRFLLKIKLTGLILLLVCLQVSASGFAQQKISINVTQMSIKNLLKTIEKQTEYRFVYSNNALATEKKISLKLKEVSLDEAMQLVLKETNLTYALKESNLVIIYAGIKSDKDLVVTGKVVDDSGLPIPGVSVKVSGLSLATITNGDGIYSIKVPDANAILEFSFVGYAKQILPVGNGGLLNVTLKTDARSLQEIIVTGYTAYKRDQSASAATVVSGDKINDVAGLTVDQILQGRVPGMSVISSTGQPGQNAAVVIRGIGSIGGSSTPLYVLDGVPIEGNYFQTINPSDIESATVLKDASAKAQYGSRGSNGVIILTTKKGKAGKVSVQYNSQYGFSDVTRPKFTMMNTDQRLQFEEEIGLELGRNLGPGWAFSPKNPLYINGTTAFRQNADHVLDSLRGINIDWRDMFLQRGKFQEQQVSVSGGNENTRYYNSLNYYKQDGIAKRTGLERFALRSNVDFNSGKFSGNVNISLGYSNASYTEGEGTTTGGTAMSAIYYALPYENPYVANGTLVPNRITMIPAILDQREGSLALERLLNSTDKSNQFKSIVGMGFAYQLLPELKIRTKAGVDYRNSTDERWINPDSYYGSRSVTNTLGAKGRYAEGSRRNFSVISTSDITYSKTFNEKHDIQVSAVHEYIYENYNSFSFVGFGLDGRLPETPTGIGTPTATTIPIVGGGKTSSALASFMGLARYTYDDKYTINGSYRYDGSTKVAPQNRWHGFYSVGANWNAKKESFLENTEIIADLNFRASYGITASPFSSSSDFIYLATFGTTSYGGNPGLRPVTAGNSDYDWEYVNEFNTGFDLSLFSSKRLHLTFDYYNRLTTNMFVDQRLSVTSGFQQQNLSTGKMRNRGVEIDLSGDVIKNSEVTWSLGINAGYNKNKILYLSPIADFISDGDTRVLQVGKAYGTYYAPDWAGVKPETGESQYYNLNGDITTTYNANTQSTTNSGSLYPKLTGGITSSVAWNGFTASVLFSFVSDVMRHNNEDLYNENQRYATSNQSVRMLEDRWKKAGDDAILQRFDIARQFTSKDIQDASFLRLRNLNIGYSLPKSVLQKLHVSGISVFVQGQNLLTWTSWRGLDPENNSVYGRFQYPNARTYTGGLKINF
ncbi:SusC/RagA family TonB-linked outer membrane protein [Pedobacter sp. MC2016-14]|uniref:SusC/RagA family TonB-linked outer membrane protein n=1 Tax=Pedobacter sp. MC2016-14 TaxID=2897327 RepID=UPI001E5AF57D|nr:SusC/RagA family TonB-linked outer membrane protein [Pedobacter sp. MC2016-14]MCD0488236.1 SusC/RagA family TonB-linked outer membrane protein [Pedobacter sp. MC2016-14]